MVPEQFRPEMKSVIAMKAPMANATVVKKPKTFWMRFTLLCIVGGTGSAPGWRKCQLRFYMVIRDRYARIGWWLGGR